MNLREFRDVLTSINIPVSHWRTLKEDAGRFIVWAETKRKSFFADGEGCEVSYTISVFFYTKNEYDEEYIERIEKAFDENHIAYSDCNIEYLEDFNYAGYHWTVEVV